MKKLLLAVFVFVVSQNSYALWDAHCILPEQIRDNAQRRLIYQGELAAAVQSNSEADISRLKGWISAMDLQLIGDTSQDDYAATSEADIPRFNRNNYEGQSISLDRLGSVEDINAFLRLVSCEHKQIVEVTAGQ